MRKLPLFALLVGWINALCLAQSETEPVPRPGLPFPKVIFKSIRAKSADVVLELRGWQASDAHGDFAPNLQFPDCAYAFYPASGKRTFLASPETYIVDGQISQDGRCIVLEYHISSGGYGDAFVGDENGNYAGLWDNSYAEKLIREGKVDGLTEDDLPMAHGHNYTCGLKLAESPARLIFTIGDSLELTYSLEKRKIVSWRKLLSKHNR